jgi:3-oxoacyl-[acyl-carrier-protein] synthase-1
MQIAVSAFTATSAAGVGLSELNRAILERRSGLRPNDIERCELDTWVGRVEALDSTSLPARLEHLHSRNNALGWLALQQDQILSAIGALKERLGAGRIGVVMGTSTASIGRTEKAYRNLESTGLMSAEFRQPDVHNLHAPGIFVAAATGLEGPAMTISTACSSSAKVFATAARWIAHGLVDAVLAGGVDSLCLSILYGFNSLQLVSASQCRPFDVERDGINLGEAAGYALLTRPDLDPDAKLVLLGYGESSDAWHMSHPHPDGKGAVLAMQRALERAQLSPDDIDYINLHGTASAANDFIETLALSEVFTARTHASSTKGWTGHALGTAGILEAVITLQAMQHDLMPGTLNCERPDPEFRFPILQENAAAPIRCAMTNSFGFGGNNAALVFGRRA